MQTDCPFTIDMPSIEECREAALVISDELLRMCVQGQCSNIQVKCSQRIRLQCREDNQIFGFTMLAYTPNPNFYGTLNYFYPIRETYWCEEPVSHECMIKALVHELAHSCGWDHRAGRNVPGNDPPRESIPECKPKQQ
jgi:hypothetical protein